MGGEASVHLAVLRLEFVANRNKTELPQYSPKFFVKRKIRNRKKNLINTSKKKPKWKKNIGKNVVY